MKPKYVNKQNEDKVFNTHFNHTYSEYPLPKYKAGNTVRISKYKKIFTKDYEPNFTEELFKIKKVIHGDLEVSQ